MLDREWEVRRDEDLLENKSLMDCSVLANRKAEGEISWLRGEQDAYLP